MATILVMEMRGFAGMATQLSKELERISITPERIRAAGIRIANEVVDQSVLGHNCTNRMHLGGDTWYFTFDNIEDGLMVAHKLLIGFQQKALEAGVFYLKPSIGLTIGAPKFDGERFLDDESISAYRAADDGKSFRFAVVGEARNTIKQIPWISSSDKVDEKGLHYSEINWQEPNSEIAFLLEKTNVSLPSLLLDSEVIYSNSVTEAISQLIKQQESSKNILAFGGPVPIDSPTFRPYLKSVIATLKNSPSTSWTILNYIPLNESYYSYAWIELCRRLSITYPNQFSPSFFTIPEGQMRPFSYHIYNKESVHIGLRSFSPQKGTPTMSSAIIFKNKRIASRFHEEFIENWRQIGPVTEFQYGKIIQAITGVNAQLRKQAMNSIEELFNE